MSVEKAMLSAKAHERKGAYQQARSIYEKRLIPFLPVSTTCGVTRTGALGVAFSFE